MTEASQADWGLGSVAEVIEAAQAAGLKLTTSQTELDETGLDFRVLHAEDERGAPWIVRTPRRVEVAAAARAEARVLRLVGPRLPVAVPDWRVHTDVVMAYPRLDGTPAMTVGNGEVTWHVIDPAAPPGTFLDSCAALLVALQRVGVEEAEAAGVNVSSMAAARTAMGQAMDRSREVLSPSDAVWDRWQRWLANDSLWSTHVGLVHGDFHPGHMLVGARGELSGVLDWTEAQVTDPSIDFAFFYGCFGEAPFHDLLARVEAAGGRVWPRLAEHAIERWAAFAAIAAEWALRTGDEAVLEHARSQLPT